MAWCWFRGSRRQEQVREVLVAEPTSKGPTPIVHERMLADCCKNRHNVKSGRNASSIFLTCLDCKHHATWLRTGVSSFAAYADLRFLQPAWDGMQSARPTSSRSAASSTDAVPKAAARPKRTARTTVPPPPPPPAREYRRPQPAAAPAADVGSAAAAAATDPEETETVTVTVTRPKPKQATRATTGAVAPPAMPDAAAPAELPAVPDHFDDEIWWSEAGPISPRRPTIVDRAAATRRTPWAQTAEDGQ